MAYRNIILDIGNVLIGYRILDMLHEHGMNDEQITRFGRALFDNPMWAELDLENIPFQEIVDRYADDYPDLAGDIRWFMGNTQLMYTTRPEIYKKVHALKEAGYHIFLLSNYGSVFYENHMRNNPVLEDIDGKIISYEVHVIKPDIRIYQILMEKYGLKPEESLFLDDRIENVEGARRAGIDSIQITSQEQLAKILDDLLAQRQTGEPGPETESMNGL